MLGLAIIDLLWGLLITVYQVRIIIRNRRIRIFNFSNLMFAFVYGFLPSLVLFRTESGTSVYAIDTSVSGITYLSIATFLSVIVHICMNIAYNGTKAKKRMREVTDNVAKTSGLVMLVIGWISLFLWTRADGGIFNFITHADGIRAGYYHLNNPFAFLEHVTRVLLFAGCLTFSSWMQQREFLGKAKMFIPAVAGIIGAFLFISAWDSRTAFGFFVLMIILVHIELRISIKEKLVRTEIFKLVIILVAVLILMVGSQSIMSSFRAGTYVSSGKSLNIFDIIETEFGFVLKTQQAVIGNAFNGSNAPQILNDLINGLVAWIPSRFISFSVPQSLWRYNTFLVSGSVIHGTVPSDILSSSISDLWFIGPIIIPFLYGRLLKRVDTFVFTKEYHLYNSVLKSMICTVAIHQISHFSIATMVSGVFYIVFGYIITWLVNRLINTSRVTVHMKGKSY